MADFTDQNIQDTYQRVIQIDGGQLQDGTGSALPINIQGNEVLLSGTGTDITLKASSLIATARVGIGILTPSTTLQVEGSISASSFIRANGSGQFGNMILDTNSLTTSQNDTTNITLQSETINIIVNDDDFIDLESDEQLIKMFKRTRFSSDINVLSNITASSNISASGTIKALSFSNKNNVVISSLGDATTFGVATFDSIHNFDNNLFEGHITASGDISASGNVTANNYFMKDHVAIAETTDKIAFGFENNTAIQIGKSGNPTIIEGHLTASGNISASGRIYGRQLEQHDMGAGSFAVSQTPTFFPFGGQSHVESTVNANQNIQKLSIVPGKPIRVIIRAVTSANGLGNTGYTCSYHATGLVPGQAGTPKLIGEQRANSTGTNHETVIFDFTNGVTSGSYDDVPVNERIYMALQSDTSVSSITVLGATALWEWDYNSV